MNISVCIAEKKELIGLFFSPNLHYKKLPIFFGILYLIYLNIKRNVKVFSLSHEDFVNLPREIDLCDIEEYCCV